MEKLSLLLSDYVELFKGNMKYCPRKEFWIFLGISILIRFSLAGLIIYFFSTLENNIAFLFSIFCQVISLALTVLEYILASKRFRDAGFSPFLILLFIIANFLYRGQNFDFIADFLTVLGIILLCLPTNYDKRKDK